jgi:hypothetical protein
LSLDACCIRPIDIVVKTSKMTFFTIVGILEIVYGSFLLCGDTKLVARASKIPELRWVIRIALWDFGDPRYRRYLGGIVLNIMGALLIAFGTRW